MPRVLVVEDEPDTAALIADELTREGFRVETVGSDPKALNAVRRERPDLVILDRTLPGRRGGEVLEWLKAVPATSSIPVLVLTAERASRVHKEGPELGADVYLSKPVSPREIVLRVRAILRHVRGVAMSAGGRVLRAGPIRVDIGSNQASRAGEELKRTPTEFRLLRALIERHGRTQSRKQLLEKAWSVESRVADRVQTRTVDMHVRRLRGKLGEVGGWIQTIRGFGYRLKVPEGVE